MPLTVKFTTGQEEHFDAEAAASSGPVFILYKRNGRKLEPANTFPVDQVAWARLNNGNIVLGSGIVKSD
jgi:hypothetical protein